MALPGFFNPRLKDATLTQVTYVEAQAAGDASKQWPVFHAPKNVTVHEVWLVPQAAITGANTNTFHSNLLNKGADGAGTTELGNVDWVSGTNGVAFDAKALVSSDKAVAAGAVLSLQRELIGTGLASPQFLVVVHYTLAA